MASSVDVRGMYEIYLEEGFHGLPGTPTVGEREWEIPMMGVAAKASLWARDGIYLTPGLDRLPVAAAFEEREWEIPMMGAAAKTPSLWGSDGIYLPPGLDRLPFAAAFEEREWEIPMMGAAAKIPSVWGRDGIYLPPGLHRVTVAAALGDREWDMSTMAMAAEVPWVRGRNLEEEFHLRVIESDDFGEREKEREVEVRERNLNEEIHPQIPGAQETTAFGERERETESTATAMEVREVWETNLHEELPRILGALETASFAAVDTEFPGFIHHTARSAGPSERYEDVRRNVDSMKILQLGLSFFDDDGRRRTWQINFRDFDISSPSDLRWEASMDLLTRSGLDFDKMRAEGVESAVLSGLLRRRHNWMGRRKPLWVTFQGLYDAAYLVKLLTGEPLPTTLRGFARLAGETLGRVIDVKHLSKFCGGFNLGLAALSRSLGLTVEGGSAHQAGTDSLLTGMVFSAMAKRLAGQEAAFEGILNGIEEERIIPSGHHTTERPSRLRDVWLPF